MIGYKVVRIVNKKRLSAWIGKEELRQYAIEYPKGKTITAPKNSRGLFIFEDIGSAKNFILGINMCRFIKRKVFKIIRVEYQKTYPINLCYSNTPALLEYFKNIEKYKDMKFYYNGSTENEIVPRGTLCVRRLKVLNTVGRHKK